MLPINEKYFFNSKVHVINLFFSQKKKNAEEMPLRKYIEMRII